MKKSIFTGFSSILVIALLLTVTGTVLAAPQADGPVVTSLTGSSSFTTSVIGVNDLPGTVVNEAGTVFPAGFPTGEKQFSGDGVKVSALTGSATLCMPLSNYQYGWSGSVYQWLNGKWTALATTITPSAEGSTSACAVIGSSGIYALLVSYTTPVVDNIGACLIRNKTGVFGFEGTPGVISLDAVLMRAEINVASFSLGQKIKYKIVNLDASNAYHGDLSGSVTVTYLDGDETTSMLEMSFVDGSEVTYNGEVQPDAVFRLYLRNCYIEIPFHLIEAA